MEYVVKSGAVHRLEGEALRTYSAGDVVELSEEQARRVALHTPLERADAYRARQREAEAERAAAVHADRPAAAAVTDRQQGAAEGGVAGSHPLHGLNSDEAQALVAKAPNVETLDAMREAEAANPKYQGGRQTVLRAIDARRAELAGR